MNPHPNKAIENRSVLSMLLTLAILIAEVVGGFWTGASPCSRTRRTSSWMSSPWG
jgi:hypothetical protein